MPDTIYIVLITCLLATNFTRIIAAFKWISEFLSSLSSEPNERLVPLYDLEGVQIGFVRITETDFPLDGHEPNQTSAFKAASPESLNFIASSLPTRHSDAENGPDLSMNRTETSNPSTVPTRSSKSKHLKIPSKSLPPSAWDGWPDTEYYTTFSSQEIAATQNLALNWSCEKVAGKRGSPNAVSWQKGKENRQRCIGILVCASHSCSFNIHCAPAIRGEGLHRQLTKKCFCGQKLRLQACGVESSTYLFRGGAYFINFGTHSHPKYTHALNYRKNQPLEFEKFVPNYDQVQHNTATQVESSSASDSEEEQATVNPEREQSRSSSSQPRVASENEVDDALFIPHDSDEKMDSAEEWEKDNDSQAAESE
ncbi:hypothetical protein R3P38DRAFT_3016702 [Favolaschia claudopus]|uniref:Uncharacterized protein n=1 Tax=Favolaschia claudopus TaxID=2862362 RepID=A0AAW0AIF4_9AGAR